MRFVPKAIIVCFAKKQDLILKTIIGIVNEPISSWILLIKSIPKY